MEGRLILPSGVDAQGVLITGHGSGPGGDWPRTRTRRDGSFTLRVPVGYGYVLGVYDLEWTSDIWTGPILRLEGQPQREIVLHGERATPLEVFVTRGPANEPFEKAWVHVSRQQRVDWTDETGAAQRNSGAIEGWLRTDEKGRARTAVGRAEIKLGTSLGGWREAKTIQVASAELVQVAFHREWAGDRVLTVRPISDGKKYAPSADALALAWTEHRLRKPVLTKDGTMRVEFDENGVSLLLADRRRGFSGFVKTKGDETELDLPMRPCARYNGTLVDQRDGSPLADREVSLVTVPSSLYVVEPQRTDARGRFEFANVPVGVPLQLTIEGEPGRPHYFLVYRQLLFEPGERRTGDVAKAEANEANTDTPDETSIAERTAGAAENCRVTGMKAIVVLEGDDSKAVKHLAGRLTNGDELDAIYRYLPVAVSAKQLSENAGALAAMKWPLPAVGEVVLVVTADGKQASASVRLASADLEAAFRRGTEFIDEHAPPTGDGRQRLEEAKAEAADSNRIVWVIAGGSRCGPCFLLARWIDQHHDVLEKDLVIVKLTAGLDAHAHEIGNEIGGADEGMPFHAMLSPDGKVLVSSKGPLGNIGMPWSIEAIRHFQTMLEAGKRKMTSAEVDELMNSLKENN